MSVFIIKSYECRIHRKYTHKETKYLLNLIESHKITNTVVIDDVIMLFMFLQRIRRGLSIER